MHYPRYRASTSDIEHTIEDPFGEDGRVVVRGRVTARHTGETDGNPRDGEVSVDRLGLLERVGAVEAPEP